MNLRVFMRGMGQIGIALIVIAAAWVNLGGAETKSGNSLVPVETSGETDSALQLDELLSVLEMAAQNPDALQAQIQSELDRAMQAQEEKQQEFQRLRRKIEYLQRLHPLLKNPMEPEESSSAPPDRPTLEASTEKASTEKPTLHTAPSEQTPTPREIPKEIQIKFGQRFANEVWPLLQEGQASCISCHRNEKQTPLLLGDDANQAFLVLMGRGYFDVDRPSALLSKLTAENDQVRMPPPPQASWDAKRIAAIRSFVNDFRESVGHFQDETAWDERFPVHLLENYTGENPPDSQDNTFLSYFQLKRKVQTIFNDDWQRNERDRFQENIHLFQGADFQLRFNESTSPSASFLTGLDLLGQDVASKAFLTRSGPFEGYESLPSPLEMIEPDEAYRLTIEQLYRKILFRSPTKEEMIAAFDLIRNVYRLHKPENEQKYMLAFDVTVTGDAGIPTTRSLSIEVLNQGHSIYQEAVNLNTDPEENAEEHEDPFLRVGETFMLKAGDEVQFFTLTNRDTRGLVYFSGIQIVGPLPDMAKEEVFFTDPHTKMRGPWRIRERNGQQWIDDDDEQKGDCIVSVPLRVERDGQYEIYLKLPRYDKKAYAERVVVEIHSHDETRLVNPPLPTKPPQGEAHFIVDQTVDTIAFWDLKTAFRFDSDQEYIEVNNKNTSKRVTADAVQLIPDGDGATLSIDDPEAEGVEEWPVFKEYAFRPYNITGQSTVNDQNKRKGELAIRYKPSKKEEWQQDYFYRVQVGFPGQRDNETHVPVIVKAAASSPIVHFSYPYHVTTGSDVEINAAASYDIQNSSLQFSWKQIGGPRVKIADAHAPVLAFSAPEMEAEQAAWEGLARALIKHPDFVFTRPVALDDEVDERARADLNLVKIAQDLVARPPLPEEFNTLREGVDLSEMIERYMTMDEFRDFYFHRIRLALESQGTVEEDEPARLWTYIAMNDRSFKELLTADYTVNTAFEKQSRPTYHGRTGLLTMKGFIKGKPGLPHFNYAAQVAEKFLGSIFEVPPEIVDQRDGVTAASTTDPNSACYSCHQLLTPLAFQRMRWTDDGEFRRHDDRGVPIDDSDQKLVDSYPYKGYGMEAFSLVAQNKEQFIRTVINTHFTFYLGREMRAEQDERDLYRALWQTVHEHDFRIKALVKAILLSDPYLGKVRRVHETASIH